MSFVNNENAFITNEQEEILHGRPTVVRNATDLQRLKLEKLMRNPDKPILIPEKPKERGIPAVPEFVRNVMGSSAGAGSGEFHVYRHLRRKEYARQKFMKEKGERERLEDEYHEKLEDNKRKADEKTAKKRAKRLKRKGKKGNKKTIKEEKSESESEESDSQSEDEQDESSSSKNTNEETKTIEDIKHEDEDQDTKQEAEDQDTKQEDEDQDTKQPVEDKHEPKVEEAEKMSEIVDTETKSSNLENNEPHSVKEDK